MGAAFVSRQCEPIARKPTCIAMFYAISALCCAACNLCGNEVRQQVPSLNHKLKAVVFERDCGAMTGFSTQISVLQISDKVPNEAGNIFIANGDLKIEVSWGSDRVLNITYPKNAKVHLKLERWQDISISYEENPLNSSFDKAKLKEAP